MLQRLLVVAAPVVRFGTAPGEPSTVKGWIPLCFVFQY